MWYLYLDESGDLGFDFVNKKPSKFFTIAILALSTIQHNRALAKAVKVTIRRKLNPSGKQNRIAEELKGAGTTIAVKRYFYNRACQVPFAVYAMTLNKLRVYEELARNKERVYNFIARQVIDEIPFEHANNTRVSITIDRSKSKREILEFNNYILRQLACRLSPSTPCDMYHEDSRRIGGLQAADLFAWGIHRKYEYDDSEWFSVYAERVQFDEVYLK